jgi:hypothetical protein
MKKIELKYSEEKYRKLDYYLRKKYPQAKKSTTTKTLVEFLILELIAEQTKIDALDSLDKQINKKKNVW